MHMPVIQPGEWNVHVLPRLLMAVVRETLLCAAAVAVLSAAGESNTAGALLSRAFLVWKLRVPRAFHKGCTCSRTSANFLSFAKRDLNLLSISPSSTTFSHPHHPPSFVPSGRLAPSLSSTARSPSVTHYFHSLHEPRYPNMKMKKGVAIAATAFAGVATAEIEGYG